jgi:large subunit ribosomal protein L15
MRLSDLHPAPGSRRKSKRLGRGHGSGRMKTSGRGQKGQKARTGHGAIPAYFEGGQMRLARRLPILRGFTNFTRKEFAIVNLDDLEERWEGDGEVNPISLAEQGFISIPAARGFVKILGNGELTKQLSFQAHKFSASARTKILAVGGTITEIPIPTTEKTKRAKKPPAASSSVTAKPAPVPEKTKGSKQPKAKP